MAPEGSARINALAGTLRSQRQALVTAGTTVDESVPALLEPLVREVAHFAPTASVRFDKLDHAAGFEGLQRRYRASSLLALVDACLASLKDAGASAGDDLPALDLSFVADPRLKAALARNDAEMRLAYAAGCWKSVVILSGGIIEAVLWDRLGRPKKKDRNGEPKELNFFGLIEAARGKNLLGPVLQKLAHAARVCRNAVHVSLEQTDPLPIDQEQARVQVDILVLACKELSTRPA